MYLYVIENVNNGLIKIGYSKNPEGRCRSLQTGNADTLKVFHTVQINESRARTVEQKLHKEIGYLRVKGEWFKINAEHAKNLIEFAVIRWEDDILLD